MKPLSGPVLTAAEMRAAEEAVIAGGTPVATLMECAGAAVAEALWRFGAGRETLILCGPGNNGGDGYVAARLLEGRGLPVRVAALRPPRAPAAVAAAALWDGPVEPLDTAAPAPVLADALFGTGLARRLEDNVSEALARLSGKARLTLAVDLPSGVGSDDGAALGAVQADYTLALGALKPAHLLQPGAALCGTIAVADIGVPVSGTVRLVERPRLAAPGADAHKYRRGMVGVVGGQLPGAALLAAGAAMRIAGYVVLESAAGGGPEALVRRNWAEIAGDPRMGAVLLGPGLGRGEAAVQMLRDAIGCVHPLVLDADALRLLDDKGLDRIRTRAAPVILTPHAGEFAHLFGEGGCKIERTREAAARSGATIVFKGADTVIGVADGRVAIAGDAPGWLASAGTGDVLAGIVAALLARGLSSFEAAQAGVWLHGEAARRAGPGLIADDLAAHLPGALATCL